MDNQLRKIRILFEIDEKGVYHYHSVEEIDEKDSRLENASQITLTEDKYSRIKSKKDTKIILNNEEKKQYLALSLSDSLLEKLLKECSQKGYQKDAYNIIKGLMEHLGSNIHEVTFEKHGGIGAFMIKCAAREKAANEVETEKKPTEIKEGQQTIDMSQIDPQAVIAKMKEKIIAQDKTVETVVNNIYNNQLIIDTQDEDLVESSKCSILLDGPTGTGKTFIIKEAAKNLSLPIIIRSATMFSAAGYKGSDLSELLSGLLEQTGGNLETAQRVIVFLDEFDKLGGTSDNELEMKKAVQQELLTYLSGAKFPIEYNGQTYEFDTSRVTFICLGAFTDLRERKIKEEMQRRETVRVRMLAYQETEEDATKKVKEILEEDEKDYTEQLKDYKKVIEEKGLRAEYDELKQTMEEEAKDPNIKITYTMSPKDYIDDGIMREMVGRFTLITATKSLGKEDLIRILKESTTSPLLQLKSLAQKIYQKDIVYSEAMIERIAEEAVAEDTGARALQTVVNGIRDVILKELMHGQSSEIELTEEMLEQVKENQKRGVAK